MEHIKKEGLENVTTACQVQQPLSGKTQEKWLLLQADPKDAEFAPLLRKEESLPGNTSVSETGQAQQSQWRQIWW